MKTRVKNLFLVCLLVAVGILANSCSEETGDYLFDITVSDDTSTASYGSYVVSGAQSTVFKHAKNVGVQPVTPGTMIMVNGEKKECEKKIKAAVNAGMDEVESQSDYCSLFDISDVTVVIKSSDKVIFSRKFKSKK